MHAWTSTLFACLITLAGTAAARADDHAGPATVDDLIWLAGHWTTGDAARWSEEHWLPPRGGLLLGSNRRGDAQGARGFEFLRIQADDDGTPVLWAAPDGIPAVAFRLTESGPHSATFENPQNEFPTRIVYRRDGDRLVATISKGDDAPRMSWTWTRTD